MDQPHRTNPVTYWACSRSTHFKARERLGPRGSETKDSDLRRQRPMSEASETSCVRDLLESEAIVSKALEFRDRDLNPFE
jgi:hypothetical protein